ncbi:hypothetical protein SCA6_002943 [Theobroma cacao]
MLDLDWYRIHAHVVSDELRTNFHNIDTQRKTGTMNRKHHGTSIFYFEENKNDKARCSNHIFWIKVYRKNDWRTNLMTARKGRNDAWDGYGGAVVYTRSAVLPESIVPELEKAAKNVGRDFNKFIRTDNTCGPEPPLVERLEKKVEEGEQTLIREVKEIEGEVEKEVKRVEKTEMTLFQKLAEGFKELQQDEENFLRGLSKEEMGLLNELKMEASEVEKLFGEALPLRKLR